MAASIIGTSSMFSKPGESIAPILGRLFGLLGVWVWCGAKHGEVGTNLYFLLFTISGWFLLTYTAANSVHDDRTYGSVTVSGDPISSSTSTYISRSGGGGLEGRNMHEGTLNVEGHGDVGMGMSVGRDGRADDPEMSAGHVLLLQLLCLLPLIGVGVQLLLWQRYTLQGAYLKKVQETLEKRGIGEGRGRENEP